MDLEQTACYACTAWHTCLVFATEVGVRLPLCESCLRTLVPRALEADRARVQPARPAGRSAAGMRR